MNIAPFETKTIQLKDILSDVQFEKFVVTENHQLAVLVMDSDGESILVWLSNEIHLKQIRYNETTEEFYYVIDIVTPLKTVSVTTSKGNITQRNLSELTRQGLNLDESNVPKLIEYLYRSEQSAERITESSFAGWKNNKFYGYPEEGREYVGSAKLTVSEGYDKNKLNTLLQEAVVLQFCLVVGLSSAMLGYLGQKLPLTSPIVHFFGSTSCGKTTGIMLALSV